MFSGARRRGRFALAPIKPRAGTRQAGCDRSKGAEPAGETLPDSIAERGLPGLMPGRNAPGGGAAAPAPNST